MAAVVRAGQASVGFWLLSCTFVFQSAAVLGGRFSNPPTSQSPERYRQPYGDTLRQSNYILQRPKLYNKP